MSINLQSFVALQEERNAIDADQPHDLLCGQLHAVRLFDCRDNAQVIERIPFRKAPGTGDWHNDGVRPRGRSRSGHAAPWAPSSGPIASRTSTHIWHVHHSLGKVDEPSVTLPIVALWLVSGKRDVGRSRQRACSSVSRHSGLNPARPVGPHPPCKASQPTRVCR